MYSVLKILLDKRPIGVEWRLIRYMDADEFREHCHDWLMIGDDLDNGLIKLGDLLSQDQEIFEQPYCYG